MKPGNHSHSAVIRAPPARAGDSLALAMARPAARATVLALSMLLAASPAASYALGAPATRPYRLVPSAPGPTFRGVGAISGGGATTRMLYDYAPEVRGRAARAARGRAEGAARKMRKVERNTQAAIPLPSGPAVRCTRARCKKREGGKGRRARERGREGTACPRVMRRGKGRAKFVTFAVRDCMCC